MTLPKRFLSINKANMRRLRMEKGWSQEELAKRAGYSERLIRKAEAGRTVSSETIRDIAEALCTPEKPVAYQDLIFDNLSMARQFIYSYDHFRQSMLNTCRDALHASFIFNCPADSNQVPFAGEWIGALGMQEFFDKFFSVFTRKPGSLHPTYLVGESHVCARYCDQLYFQGLALPPFWVNLHFQFKDGLISRLDDEYDTKAAAAALDNLIARQQTAHRGR